MTNRIQNTFADKKKKLVTFVTGGDPNVILSEEILKTIIKNGADIIEIGMPFSDPMADGPTIQLSSNRSLKNGTNLDSIFALCKNLRKFNDNIPIILMGYYNVVLNYEIDAFTAKCAEVGIDGIIIVDLQPEEDPELNQSLKKHKIDLIRLITPNSTNKRIKMISNNASGFLYYVTVTGITGHKSADINELNECIKNIRNFSSLPIVAGFGINSKEQVGEICKIADGVVVGSSLVKIIENNINEKKKLLNSIGKLVKELKDGTQS